MKISRRNFNNAIKIMGYVRSNAVFACLSEGGNKLAFGSLGTRALEPENIIDSSAIYWDYKNSVRKFLLPLLESNRQILYDDIRTIEWIKRALKDTNSSIPKGYVDAMAEDIRYAICGFMDDRRLIQSWNTESLSFGNETIHPRFQLENRIAYARKCTRQIVDLIEQHSKDLIIMQSKVYLSGPISNNSDYRSDFAKAEADLTAQGFEVLNPVTLAEPITSDSSLSEEQIWKQSMAVDLRALVMEADEMALIEKEGIPSKGVAIEKAVAAEFSINVNPAHTYRKRRPEEQTTADEMTKLSMRGAVLARALGIIG